MNKRSLFCTWTSDHRLASSSPYSCISLTQTQDPLRIQASQPATPDAAGKPFPTSRPFPDAGVCSPVSPVVPLSCHTITQMMLHTRLAGQLMGARSCRIPRGRFLAPFDLRPDDRRRSPLLLGPGRRSWVGMIGYADRPDANA